MKSQLKLAVIIVDRSVGRKVVKSINKYVNVINVMYGHGTAHSEVLAVLGIGEPSKDVILCTVMQDKIADLTKLFVDKYKFGKAGTGIFFTIPITSVGGMATLQSLAGKMFK
ncbi:MAG: hypothetical protein IKC47_03490 [Clostridia bacterium]|nr:hypothetical protein [Clostridia bacterium]